MTQCNEVNQKTNTEGLIFDIYRGTSHDGPGLRTTVFFKGCPLRCTWCQNPEGINPKQELWWDDQKCIGCMLCQKACNYEAIRPDDNGIKIDQLKCTLCGVCVKTCPSKAMAYTGTEWTLEKLISETLKDKDYYHSFGGGVTASGGEPLMQHRFVTDLFKILKEKGVNTALDTSGFAPNVSLEALLKYVDCVLLDLKIFDSKRHKHFTGQSNELILKNACYIAEYIRNKKGDLKLWIRTPLIPGITATNENVSNIAQFIKENLNDVVQRWELCSFNSICVLKYQKMGIDWEFKDEGTMFQNTISMLKAAALSFGFSPEKLIVSGFTNN